MLLIGRIAHCFEVVPAIGFIEEIADAADGAAEAVVGPGGAGAEMGFQFREGHLDGIKIGAIGRQEEEPGAPFLQTLLCGSALYGRRGCQE